MARLLRSPVLRAWLVSRGVVLAALLTALLLSLTERASLLSWDAAWYDDIAVHGYGDSPEGAVRFFPAWPLLARWTATVVGVPPGVMLVVLANAAALAYLALARHVASTEIADPAVAARVPAVVALAPAGAVLVMGYSEAFFGVLLCLVLLTARRGHWLACAGAGLVGGALRPTGVLLALPVAIEAVRGLRTAGPGEIARRLTAVGAPAVGLGAYLAWAWVAYGDPLTPFRAQFDPALRGGTFVDPWTTLADIPALLPTREIVGLVLNFGAVLLAFALLVVSARRLPLSFTAFAAATLLVAVTARDLRSFERYACSALPLLLAAAIVLSERPRLRRWALLVAPVVLFAHALLTFSGWYLP